MVTLFNFGEAAKLVSKEDAPFHIPSTLYAFLFICLALPTHLLFSVLFCCCLFFVLSYGHPIGCHQLFLQEGSLCLFFLENGLELGLDVAAITWVRDDDVTVMIEMWSSLGGG